MPRCIYCKKEITPENKSIEHVFPASFGCPDDWVLDCVCKPCNNSLGVTVENWFANDSLEGVFRLRTLGSRSGQKVRAKRFRARIPMKEKYRQFQGAIMEKDYDVPGHFAMPPQAGFKNEKGEYVYFTQADLSYKPNLEKAKSLSQKQIKVLAPQSQHAQMMSFLKERGIIVQPNAEGYFHLGNEALEPGGGFMVDIEGEIDADIQRAAAKIAFNYVAKIQGADFVLDKKFDAVRDFINGGPYQKLVEPVHEPILMDDLPDKRHLLHIFIHERVGDTLYGIVSLFNQGMAYRVTLNTQMGPLWYEMTSGHIFNLKAKKMSPLGHMKIPPQPRAVSW